jgi:hypothetical protein
MESNKLILFLGVGAAGYLLYNYGVSQGWWSSLTGPSVPVSVLTAAQQAALIAQARNGGLSDAQIQTALNLLQAQALSCGASWNPATGTCGHAAQGTGVPATTPAPVSSPTSSLPPSTSVAPATPAGITAAQLISASGKGSTGTLNPDQWNFYETQINPSAAVTDFSAQGWTRPDGVTQVPPSGGSNQLTAAQYVALRQQAGLSGFGNLYDPTGYGNTVPHPYHLVSDEYNYDGYLVN